MITFRSDRSNESIPHDELSTLRLQGVLRQQLGRSVIHLTKAESAALCAWLGVTLARPDLEHVPGPEAVVEADYLADARRKPA